MITYEKYAEIRDSKGLTDGKIAKICGFGRSTFTDWKSGRSLPKADKMIKIANALQADYLEFVGPVGKFSSYNPENMNKPPVEKEESNTDLEFIDLYKNADPDIQKAVLLLLKSAKQEP